MKETPLIFCTAMVQAYRVGLKSQTRRIVKLTSSLKRMGGNLDEAWVDGKGTNEEYLHVPCVNDSAGEPDETVQRLFNPYGVPGENETELWIREAWYDYGRWYSREQKSVWRGLEGGRVDGSLRPLYVADRPRVFHDGIGNNWNAEENERCRLRENWTYWRKKPSIFLPRWACRMTMPLIKVRAERLQDISMEDIKAEGFSLPLRPRFPLISIEQKMQCIFADGWDKINGKRAGCKWADNPRVWVLEFPRYVK